MTYAKLSAVAARAIKDPAFFKSLQQDPRATLEKAGLHLSPADLTTLQANLRPGPQQVNVDVPKLIIWAQSQVGGSGASGAPIGDPWDFDWGAGWSVRKNG
jgi:hypothetical protein